MENSQVKGILYNRKWVVSSFILLKSMVINAAKANKKIA